MRPEGLPSRAQVLEWLFDKLTVPRNVETVATKDAYGRVLAEDVISLCDKPVYRASRMDGVAVKSERFKDGTPDASEWKLGIDYIRADTGDDFDDAFDATIAIEKVEILPNGGLKFVDDLEPIEAGSGVSGKGDSLTTGAVIGTKGAKLSPCDLAAIAMGAVAEVSVIKKPKVAFIPTGSELIPLGQIPQRGQSVDANSLIAEYIIKEMGAEPIIYPIAVDDHKLLSDLLSKALSEADIVVLSAGTSKGSEDYCHQILAERGELICHGVATAPGRPLAIAIVDGKPVVNVGGPPLGCYNGFDWCVRAIVDAYLGLPPKRRHIVKAKLLEDPNQHRGPGGSGGRGPGGPGGPGGRRGPGGPGAANGKFEMLRRFNVEKTPEGYVARPVGGFGGGNGTLGLRADAQCYGNPEVVDGLAEIEIVK